MSEAVNAVTEVASTPATAPIAQQPAAVPAPGSVPNIGEPGWLKARTDRAAEKAAKDAKKETKEALRAAEKAAKEAGKAVQAANAEVQAAKAFADTVLSDLPAEDRDAIVKASGGSVAKQLEMLAAYRIGKGSAAKAAPVEPVTPAVPSRSPGTSNPNRLGALVSGRMTAPAAGSGRVEGCRPLLAPRNAPSRLPVTGTPGSIPTTG